MLMHPWTSDRLVAQHRTDLARLAPRRRTQPAGAVAHPASPGPLTRRVGNALIAVGRRLAGPDSPALGGRMPAGRAAH